MKPRIGDTTPEPFGAPLTEDERREREMLPSGLPQELEDVAAYLEGEYDHMDEERRYSFEYGSLNAWLDLSHEHRSKGFGELLKMIRRLQDAPSLKTHWLNLYSEVSKARQAARKSKRLAGCSFGGIVLDSMLEALMPVARTPAAELKTAVAQVRVAADALADQLSLLRRSGMNVGRFLPCQEDIADRIEIPPLPPLDDVEAETKTFILPAVSEQATDAGHVLDNTPEMYGLDDVSETEIAERDNPYQWAKMLTYTALGSYERELGIKDSDDKDKVAESRSKFVDRAIKCTVGDVGSVLGTLRIISDRARRYLEDGGITRRNVPGDQRVAWDLAQILVRRFRRHFGRPR